MGVYDKPTSDRTQLGDVYQFSIYTVINSSYDGSNVWHEIDKNQWVNHQ